MLGVGVGMLLTADLGSDGYSTFVNGLALTLDVSFWVVNLVVGTVLVVLPPPRRPARRRHDRAGRRGRCRHLGPAGLVEHPGRPGRPVGALVLAFPVLAVGIAAYLGSNTGAGPAEAAALAWDPPVPFRWSYSLVQGGGALGGYLLGATIGVGTIAVIVALGPLVDLASRRCGSTSTSTERDVCGQQVPAQVQRGVVIAPAPTPAARLHPPVAESSTSRR